VSAVLGKLAWFAAGPAYTAFSPFQTHGVIWLAATSVIAIVYSIWVQSKKSVAEFASKITVVIACLFLTHLPSLVAIENTLIRAEVSLSLLAAALICAALQTIAGSIRVGARAYQTVALAACLGMAVWAGWTILVTNVWPQASEILLVERELEKRVLPVDRPIVLVGNPVGTSMSGRYCDDAAMIGCASSTWQYALPNMVRLWMRDRGLEPSRYKLLFLQSPSSKVAVSFEPNKTTYEPIPDDALLIDMGRVVKP